MKRILLFLLSGILLLSTAVVPASAEETVHAKATFDSGEGAYLTSWMGVASANVMAGKSVFVKAINAFSPGSLGDDVTQSGILAHGGYSNGTRRTKLYPLSDTVKAGTYDIYIWIADPDGARTDAGSDFGLMLTFHNGGMADDELRNDWNDAAKTNAALMVFNTHQAKEDEELLGVLHWDAYAGSKAVMAPTGQTVTNTIVWEEYKATVELTADSAQVALWLYQWSGYDNKSAIQFYVDNVRVATEAPETSAPQTDPVTESGDVGATEDTAPVPVSTDEPSELPEGSTTLGVSAVAAIITSLLVVVAAVTTVMKKRKGR